MNRLFVLQTKMANGETLTIDEQTELRGLLEEQRDAANADAIAKAIDAGIEAKSAAMKAEYEKLLEQHSTRTTNIQVTEREQKALGRKEVSDLIHAQFLASEKGGGNREMLDGMKAKGLTGATDSAGGYLIRDQYLDEIIQEMNEYGDAMIESSVIQTTARTMKTPKVLTSPTAYMLATETTAITASAFTLGENSIDIMDMASMVVMSNNLLADADFDVTQIVDVENAKQFAAKVDTEFFVGATFTGIMKNADVLTKAATGGITGLKYDDFVAMRQALTKQYRKGAKFYIHRSAAEYLFKLKNSVGMPLFVPSPVADIPATILGYPVEEIESMPDTDFTNGICFFGNLKRTTKIWMRQDIAIDVNSTGSVTDENSSLINLWQTNQSSIRTIMRFAPEIVLPTKLVKLI